MRRTWTHEWIAPLVVALALLTGGGAFACADDEDPGPGIGTLIAGSGDEAVELPLLALEVNVDVTGLMARGSIVESFRNTTGRTIDAVYVLPLPERAAVDTLVMQIGARRIVSVVEEKRRAEALYDAARANGQKAALVAQERPNLFTTRVANVNAGETVLVAIAWFEEVTYRGGEFETGVPLTYTPRYAPAQAAPAEGALPAAFVPAAAAAAPRATLHASIDAGVPLEAVFSPSHTVDVVLHGATARVAPRTNPVAADRDFVLRWRPQRGAGPGATLFVEDRPEGRYGLLMLVPPAERPSAPTFATDTLFVLDISGSMEGPSLFQAKAALEAALARLRPQDTFGLLAFNTGVVAFADGLEPAVDAAKRRAHGFIEGLAATGGTEVLPALEIAMQRMALRDGSRPGRIVLITDGAVSNEEEIFTTVAQKLGDVRLHVVGIGAAPNRFFMRRLARSGGGLAEFIGAPDGVAERIDGLFARIERPMLTDITLEWNGAPPDETYPDRIPDLYADEPLFVSFKLGPGHPGAHAVLSGRAADRAVQITVPADANAAVNSGVAVRWARANVEAQLEKLDQGADVEQVKAAVVGVARTFHLVTPWTSLVAVEQVPTAAGPSSEVRVANALPPGQESVLPQGGTDGPLLTRIGLVLAVCGVALWLVTWRKH